MGVRQLVRCCVLALAALSCSTMQGAGSFIKGAVKAPPKPVPEAKDVVTRLFLIGDAGVPLVKDPVLASLSREVSADPQHAVVVYLGDNIYPRGLPPAGDIGRKEAERRIDEQMQATRAQGAQTIFVPGNHDWNRMSAGGWDAMRRETEYVREKGGPGVALLPEDGCPGPVVRDFDPGLRLVALDTQWWLQPPPKPGPGSSCPTHTETQVLDALDAALRDAGPRQVVVVAHHPLASGGAHGGYFSWQDHIFPLRATRSWLWIPLPGIGSAYPLSRIYGVTPQDMSNALNRKMREALSGVMQKHPPLVYAAGHEHSLQVFQGKGNARYLLVSGAGAFGHVTQTAVTPETLFAAAMSGYMRIELEKSGRARLGVITLDADGKPKEAAAYELLAPPEAQPKPTAPPGSVVKPPATMQQEAPQQKPGVPESQPAPTKPPDKQKPPDQQKPPEPPPGAASAPSSPAAGARS